MVDDVVGGAADEELERPGPRRLAFGVEGADGIEVVLPMRRKASPSEDDVESGPDADLAGPLLGFVGVHVADDLVATPPNAARSGAELFGDT